VKNIFAFLFICFFILSCQKEDTPEPEPEPCSELVDGVYIFPTEWPDSTLTQEEIHEYWNIPKEVLSCISTEGLIISCYNQKFPILISMGNGYQHGYQVVKGWNRGFEELETRDEAPEKLIEFYATITIPTRINYNLFSVEVLMAQDAVLTKLTKEQKTNLLNLCLKYHPEVRKIWEKSSFLYDGTVVIMCQLMRLDNYIPFLEHLATDRYLQTFVDGRSYTLTFERGDTIIAFTQNYLKELSLDSN
jgi:hypothetical protein